MDYKNTGVSEVLKFFLSHISLEEWAIRRSAINDIIRKNISNFDARFLSVSEIELYTGEDAIGWQLFLMESFLSTGFGQSAQENAKLGPFFEKIGENLSDLKKISGLKDRITRMMLNSGITPSSALFELVVALTWQQNGWNVEFIVEAAERTPDLKAEKNGITYFIECKRLSEISDFSKLEAKSWQRLFLPVKDFLYAQQKSFILDINFLVDIINLDTNYLFDLLHPFLVNPRFGTQITIEGQIDFIMTEVDWVKINDHLSRQWVKYPSNQLELLIFGEAKSDYKFSSLFSGKLIPIGPELGNNLFVDRIDYVCGATWNICTEYSVDTKARHIKRQLVNATKQVPSIERSVIHLGIDTVDGSTVEELRYLKNRNMIHQFDLDDKNICALYVHHFQSYSPPDKPWFLDETVTTFLNGALPIEKYNLISDSDKTEFGVHWRKNPPS